MQNFLVVLIIALAALVVGIRLLRLWRRPATTSGCGCDCGGCSSRPAGSPCQSSTAVPLRDKRA
ncbi:MAG: hypothetical protein BWK76_12800 [Desulfobulbaceae bacterium A2]|nr:MAG: hypothetical protein BWK76_12800 [Desulfobulbaceae bacterium A2]